MKPGQVMAALRKRREDQGIVIGGFGRPRAPRRERPAPPPRARGMGDGYTFPGSLPADSPLATRGPARRSEDR
jgi:hypothetical protein